MAEEIFSQGEVDRITAMMQARVAREYLKTADTNTIQVANICVARLVSALARAHNKGNSTQRELDRIKMNAMGGLEEDLGLSRNVSSLIVNSTMSHMKQLAEGFSR